MDDNNQYPDYRRGTFAPVGIVLVVAVAGVLGIFVYVESNDASSPDTAPGTVVQPAPNPNRLAPTPPPGN